MLQQMDSIFSDFQNKIATLEKQADVLALKSTVIGKKGSLAEILKSLKDATPEERKTIGPKSNQIKQDIEKMVQKKLQEIEIKEINEKLNALQNYVNHHFSDIQASVSNIDSTVTNSLSPLDKKSTTSLK